MRSLLVIIAFAAGAALGCSDDSAGEPCDGTDDDPICECGGTDPPLPCEWCWYGAECPGLLGVGDGCDCGCADGPDPDCTQPPLGGASSGG